MNYRSPLLAFGFSLMSLPALAQDFVSAEKYSDNPMDGVGVAHNAYAGCMAANHSPTGKPTPIEVVIYTCGLPTDGSPEDAIRKYTDLANSTRPDPKLSLAGNMKPYRDYFNDQQFSYIEYMDKVLTSATSPEEADKGLKEIEAQAIKDLGRADGDLAVLGIVSTGRHSIELWTKDRPLADQATRRGIPWQTIGEVVVADMTGYASGVKACGKLCGYVNGAVQSVISAFD